MVGFVDLHVGPTEGITGGYGAGELDSVGEPDGQPAEGQRIGGRPDLSVDAEPPLAVEHLALEEVSLGDRHHVGVERHRRAGASR